MAEIRNGLVVVRTGDEESLLLLAAGEVAASYESLGVGTSCTYGAGDLTGIVGVGFAGRKPGGFFELNHEQGEEQPYFLDSCSMCKRPLGTNKDIFMYRGNVPFCSEECRQDQIDTDEMKNRKWSNLTAKAMLSAVKNPNVSVRRAAAGTVVAG